MGNDPVNYRDPQGLGAATVMDAKRQTFNMIGNDLDKSSRSFARDPLGTVDSVLSSYPQTRIGKPAVGAIEALGLVAATSRGVSKAAPKAALSVIPSAPKGVSDLVNARRIPVEISPPPAVVVGQRHCFMSLMRKGLAIEQSFVTRLIVGVALGEN